jgi:hypothetical protein
MVDIYLVANPLALSSVTSHTAIIALHNTLESTYNTHLLNPSINTLPPSRFTHYSPLSSGIYRRPLNPTHTITYPIPARTSLTFSPTCGVLAWKCQYFINSDGSKKGGSSPLEATATHPTSDTCVKTMVISTPPSHTINRVELVGIDIGMQLGHTHLLTDNACSLRLIQSFMKCPPAYRHNIHRDTIESITHTLATLCDSSTHTLSESGTDSYTDRVGPTRGPVVVIREVRRRKMAAGANRE